MAADWQHGRRDDSYLLRGGRLAAVDPWASKHPGELGSLKQQFLEASRGLATRELTATRRSNRRLRVLAGGLAVLLVAALAAGGLAVNASNNAQAQTRLALSRQLAGGAERLVDTQPDTAILAGLQSLSLARDHSPEPSAGLMTALGRVTHASRLLTGHTDAVNAVAFSHDDALRVSVGTDQTVQLWNPSWWARPSSDWAEAGCGLVNRNLSRAEWDQLAGERPYQRTCPTLPAGGGTPDDAPAAQYTP